MMFPMYGFSFFPLFPIIAALIGARIISRTLGGRRRRRRYLNEEDGEGRALDGVGGPPAVPKDAAGRQARVFKLALARRGRLTVSDVVLEMDLGVNDSEKLLQSMVDGERVRMEVDDRGRVLYEFPEIMARFEEE